MMKNQSFNVSFCSTKHPLFILYNVIMLLIENFVLVNLLIYDLSYVSNSLELKLYLLGVSSNFGFTNSDLFLGDMHLQDGEQMST